MERQGVRSALRTFAASLVKGPYHLFHSKVHLSHLQSVGKLGETRKVFKVKSTKSARNVEINHSRSAESPSRAASLGCKMLIAETIKRAFHTLQALVEVIIGAKSSSEALNLIIVAQFALILSVSPQNVCGFHAYYQVFQEKRIATFGTKHAVSFFENSFVNKNKHTPLVNTFPCFPQKNSSI